ncbi:Uncharacterised protein [Oligella urethralis]|uniref:hypothetical protein n=1 Tax=Oligella urethralis TaxID=90245 RepID=UPI000DFD0A82|nr:hypothetical protein [Oligella urethralis]SUA53987.1 Uncharacterised protein [Oligella urethralis]
MISRFNLMALLVATMTLSACASSEEERAASDNCAVSNHRIIQSNAQVGPGPGNFLNRHRQDSVADRERERARRLKCGQY